MEELVTVTMEESARDYLPKRITHGHATIGAVRMCQEDDYCKPSHDVVVSFDPTTRRILGVYTG
jgi:hypothetical protein